MQSDKDYNELVLEDIKERTKKAKLADKIIDFLECGSFNILRTVCYLCSSGRDNICQLFR